jgi:hypothetical protein
VIELRGIEVIALPPNIGHQLQDKVAPALLFLLQGR